MTTVASRTFRSTPGRDALATWTAIVDLLTKGQIGAARTELLAVGGVAASVIADQAPKDAAIVVTCDGPRTRIYCLYDDDAIDGGDANEDALGFDPLKGDHDAGHSVRSEGTIVVLRHLLLPLPLSRLPPRAPSPRPRSEDPVTVRSLRFHWFLSCCSNLSM